VSLLRRAAAACVLGLLAGTAQAASLQFCDRPLPGTAAQQDRLLRVADWVRQELAAADAPAALIARSGLDLHLLDQRYSHTGISLKDSPNGPWSVRQLYYACDEARPRLYDQGLAGFVLGADEGQGRVGHVWLLLLPTEAAAALAATALDKPQALGLLNPVYSANAHAWGQQYQNCNQWVAELLATAWAGPLAAPTATPPRERAQRWLAAQGYQPTVIEVGALMGLGLFIPWVHDDDHPAEDLARTRYRVSMPASIAAFVQARLPGARRVELCHDTRQLVIRHGWQPLSADCRPEPGDRVLPFADMAG
jgi:hypothetical protein